MPLPPPSNSSSSVVPRSDPSQSSQPLGTAVRRSSVDPQNPFNGADFHNSDQLRQWIQWEVDHNPNYHLPTNGAFYLDENNQVHPHRDADSFLMKHPWVIPLIGIGVGFGAAALAGPGTGGVGGLADAGSASVNGGVGVGSGAAESGLPGLAGAGSASVNGGAGVPSGAAANVGAANSALSTSAKISAAMRAAGLAVDSATNAAAKNRSEDQNFDLRSQDEFNRELMDYSDREDRERKEALKDAYRDSWYQNRQAGPFDTRGLQPVSPDFMNTLDTAGQRARDMLAKNPQYSTGALPPPQRVPRARKSPGESIGQYAGPTLEGLAALMSIFGK